MATPIKSTGPPELHIPRSVMEDIVRSEVKKALLDSVMQDFEAVILKYKEEADKIIEDLVNQVTIDRIHHEADFMRIRTNVFVQLRWMHDQDSIITESGIDGQKRFVHNKQEAHREPEGE